MLVVSATAFFTGAGAEAFLTALSGFLTTAAIGFLAGGAGFALTAVFAFTAAFGGVLVLTVGFVVLLVFVAVDDLAVLLAGFAFVVAEAALGTLVLFWVMTLGSKCETHAISYQHT